jgi:serine/alanine adding enzyme
LDIRCNNANIEEWDAYVANHPRGLRYHEQSWKAIIEESFGHSTYYFSAHLPGGQLVGVLPLARLRSRLFGDFLVSLPFFTYGGVLGDCETVENDLMNEASGLAQELGCTHVEFRDTTRFAGFPSRTDKVSMRLDLPATSEELWSSFSGKLRAQIRRAEREKPVVLVGGMELLEDFYSVFAHNMRDLGTPVYAFRFFATIFEHLADVRLVVLRLQQRPVSAAVLIGHKDMLEIPWASTLRSVNPLGTNMLLYWTALRHAIEAGYSKFDFGRSTPNSGTYRFKKQWGAVPVPLFWHYWLPDGESVPKLNPENPKYRFAIALWKRLPLWVANKLGPPIVRNLP